MLNHQKKIVLWQVKPEETAKLNGPLSIKENKYMIKKLNTKGKSGSEDFISHPNIKDKLTPMLFNL